MKLVNRVFRPRTPERPHPTTPSISHPVGYEILFDGDNPVIAE